VRECWLATLARLAVPECKKSPLATVVTACLLAGPPLLLRPESLWADLNTIKLPECDCLDAMMVGETQLTGSQTELLARHQSILTSSSLVSTVFSAKDSSEPPAVATSPIGSSPDERFVLAGGPVGTSLDANAEHPCHDDYSPQGASADKSPADSICFLDTYTVRQHYSPKSTGDMRKNKQHAE